MKLLSSLAVFATLALAGCVQPSNTTQSYGNDMLVNPQASGNLANDMLPSAEMIAFQKVDQRLNYRDARIEYDADNCAVYQGIGPNGRIAQTPLMNAANQQICSR